MRHRNLRSSSGRSLLFGMLVIWGHAGTLEAEPERNHTILPATERYQTLPGARPVETWTFRGFAADKYADLRLNLSGIAGNGNVLVVGADEGSSVQVLKKVDRDTGASVYEIEGDIALGNGEADIEALAADGNRLFVIGSHSMRRKRVKSWEELREDPDKYGDGSQCRADDEEAAEEKGCWKWNRKRLKDVKQAPNRKRLFVLETDNEGRPKPNQAQQLRLDHLLEHHAVLKGFLRIPSKENGVDIEGLAVDDGRLYVGFRGPVLRGSYAVVLVLDWKKEDGRYLLKSRVATHYLNLDGRGIRGMTSVIDTELRERIGGKFLVLAGPIGDEPSGWVLYRWDGKDSIPGLARGPADRHTKALCRIPPPPNEPLAKAEGLMVLPFADHREIRFLIVYDTAIDGGPIVFSCAS